MVLAIKVVRLTLRTLVRGHFTGDGISSKGITIKSEEKTSKVIYVFFFLYTNRFDLIQFGIM